MNKKTMRDATFYGGLAVLLVVLIGADLAYFSSLDAAPAPHAAAPSAPSTGATAAADECGYNEDVPKVAHYESLLSFRDPIKGDPNAPVTVIEYFDPNCPHCRDLYPIMKEVAEQHGDQAKFAYIPFPLWPDPDHPRYSLDQVEALHAAAQEGKFFDMLERQLQAEEDDLAMEQLQQIAEEIGMDPQRMKHRIESDVYLGTIMRQRNQGRDTGITGMPAVFINGRLVESGSRTVECLGTLIEEAASEAEASEG